MFDGIEVVDVDPPLEEVKVTMRILDFFIFDICWEITNFRKYFGDLRHNDDFGFGKLMAIDDYFCCLQGAFERRNKKQMGLVGLWGIVAIG